jgi:hypothetical protein
MDVRVSVSVSVSVWMNGRGGGGGGAKGGRRMNLKQSRVKHSGSVFDSQHIGVGVVNKPWYGVPSCALLIWHQHDTNMAPVWHQCGSDTAHIMHVYDIRMHYCE